MFKKYIAVTLGLRTAVQTNRQNQQMKVTPRIEMILQYTNLIRMRETGEIREIHQIVYNSYK